MFRMRPYFLAAILALLAFSALYGLETGNEFLSRKYHNPSQMHAPMLEPCRADSAHGFDVQKYEITLNINDATHYISGNVKATVNAEANLSSIVYELTGLTVSAVSVNDVPATFSHSNGLLTINLNIPSGQQFTTQVYYSGTPQLSNDVYHNGMTFAANTVSTVSDPDAGRFWWPSYDHPWDKAIVDLHITMRSDWKVAANGIRTGIVDNGNGTSTTHWLGQHPMTTYLVCITAGPYVEINQTVPQQNNLPIQNFVTQSQYNNALLDLQHTPAMVAYYSQLFGAYPFEKYGHAVVSLNTYSAMEHQTMTTLANYIINGTGSYELVIAHELVHQWYGNAVSFLNFPDVWLSEGFATYGEHLWVDKRLGWQQACDYVDTAYHQYYLNYENSAGPQTIYNPSFSNYFAPPSYEKAASVLHMLRLKIGNTNFFQLLQQWFSTYSGGNGITAEFQAMAEQISGQDLDQFFAQWIYGSGVPSAEYSLWQAEDISRVKVRAKTFSPTNTAYTVEIPFRFVNGDQADSLVVVAGPQGLTTEFLYAPSLEDCSITANYHNWTLLRELNELRPELSECLPSNNSVLLSWEPYLAGVDSGYLVYRKLQGAADWDLLTPAPITEPSYLDATVANGSTYLYAIAVLDSQGYKSMLSNMLSATPQAFSFASDLLIVDETRDGNGANINPTDSMVDDFYSAALEGLEGTISAWDCAAQGTPDLATLGQYKLVLWHADDFSQNQLQENQNVLGGYILGGGKVVLSGWKTAGVLSSGFLDRFTGGISPVYTNSPSLLSAQTAGTYSLPELIVDPAKLTASWNNMLPYIYSFPEATDPLYTATMGAGDANGQSVAFRYDHTGSLVMFGMPLYFMQAPGVRNLLHELLPVLNPALPVQEEDVPALAASINISPNPFNPSTTISYYLPQTGKVELSLYNLKGQKVKTILDKVHSAGTHQAIFEGTDKQGRALSSGVYLLRFSHSGGSILKKLTLMK